MLVAKFLLEVVLSRHVDGPPTRRLLIFGGIYDVLRLNVSQILFIHGLQATSVPGDILVVKGLSPMVLEEQVDEPKTLFSVLRY